MIFFFLNQEKLNEINFKNVILKRFENERERRREGVEKEVRRRENGSEVEKVK